MTAADVTRKRRIAERAGRLAEWRVMLAYLLRGYEIVAHRYKAPVGEIDLIMRRRDTVVFVEVKARPTLEDALAAVRPAARRRIARAADAFMARRPRFAGAGMRYDIAAVIGWRVVLTEDAWRLD